MPARPLHPVLHYLRRSASEQGGELTDAQLLDAFVRRRDEAAFELLVWRHAALVLGACRRLLRDAQEAEDAFQATFLVFVRKARSIRQVDSVGAWLHRVACRIAQRARARAARRACLPLPGDDLPARASADEVIWRDLRPVLDEEVNRLPEKYRRAFVLCYLEGHTNEQAARQLGCPKGTVLSRLVRGREWLRVRLARRGVVLSGALLTTLLMSRACAALPPAPLVRLTVKAAIPFAAGNAAAGLVSARSAAWTEGALNAMFLSKLKVSAAVALMVALAATAVGLFVQPSPAGPRAAQERRAQPRPEDGRQPREGRGAPAPEVRGVLKAVDAGKGTITVTVGPSRREDGEQEKTFTLGKNTEVGIGVAGVRRGGREGGGYREGKLADLGPGALVVLQLTADGKGVASVLAEGPTVRGVIKAVDAGQRALTLTTVRSGRREEAAESQDKTYQVSPKAEIGVDDGRGRMFSLKQAKLADLPVGAIASIKLSADLKHAHVVLAEGLPVYGTVKAVDAGKRRVTLTTRAGRGEEGAEERTFDLAADADILFDDGKGRLFSVREGKLGDLPVGAVAQLRLTPDQKTVTTLRAEGPTVVGWFKAADAGKKTITLVTRRARDGSVEEEKTFAVAPGTRVYGAGKAGGLADLKADENGPPVTLRLSLDQQEVRSLTVGGRGR